MNRILLTCCAAAIALIIPAARAQDEPVKPADEKTGTPTQTLTIKALTFDAPTAWKGSKVEPPARGRPQMRLAEATIPAAEGDAEGAELVLTNFRGNGGGVEANVARWTGQFQADQGQADPEAKVEDRTSDAGVKVTTVEISGHYVAPISPGQPERHDKPGYRLLAAIVLTDTEAYFFKLTGPDKTVTAARPDFDKLVKSLKVGEN